MQNNELEAALRRVRKCLALSKSDNEHEAAAALRQSQKLMEAHGITAEGLASAEVSSSNAKSTACVRPAQWEHSLARTICDAFGCEVIIHGGWFDRYANRNGAMAQFVFIGVSHLAQTAAYSFAVLSRQVVKARIAYLKDFTEGKRLDLKDKLAAGEAFTRGYVQNVKSKVAALAPSPEHFPAMQAMKTKLLGGKSKMLAATQRGFHADSFDAGMSSGKDASLHAPVNGKDAQLALR